MIGETLGGRYEIKEVIGQGGFAIVYRARQLSIDRDVAIKVLTLDASQDDSIGRRFEAEAKIISQLRHPNTLKLMSCPSAFAAKGATPKHRKPIPPACKNPFPSH